MLRLFIKFYLIIVLPLLIFFWTPVCVPVGAWIEDWANENYINQFNIYFVLIERELREHHVEEWSNIIAGLQEKFGYRLSIESIGDFHLSERKQNLLKQGKIIFFNKNVGKLIKLVPGSTICLGYNLDEDRNEAVDKFVRGPTFLLNQYLISLPATEWKERLNDLQKNSRILIQLCHKDSLPDDKSLRDILQQGKAVYFGNAQKTFTVYAPSALPDFIYKFGPIRQDELDSRIVLLERIVPAVVLGIGILALAWPLYRDMRKLRQAADAYGRGDFSKRVSLVPTSSLASLAKAFNIMANKVENLLSSHKELTNAISHELKTPVSRLRFSLEMLRENKEVCQQQRHIENMERDIFDLETLIRELLDHARFDRSLVSESFTKVDVIKWARKVLAPYRDISEKVVFDCLESSCVVRMDDKAMGRVLENLLDNGLRFAKTTLRIRCDCRRETVCLVVEDDGPGVPEAERKRIFDPFVRIDTSRNRATGGSGLGLAIVKRILELHGGTVQCRQSDLGGAAFILCWKKR